MHLHFLKYILIDYFTYRRYFLSIYMSVHFQKRLPFFHAVNTLREFELTKRLFDLQTRLG